MLLSETLPGNLLPQFKFQLGDIEGGSLNVKTGGGSGVAKPYTPFDTAPDEIWDHASPDLRAPSLPYLLQDQWTCGREDSEVPTIAFENDRLKLSITPQWGARIWSVYDKVLKRDWTFANKAHQPANIGVLKSWSAGGIEFNWSPGVIGHTVFSESPAFVALVERGPVLRAYEFDRRNQSVWQVDIYLPNTPSAGGGSSADASDKLWIHPKVTETTGTDLQGYWWTCVAVPAAPSTRIITPAEWNLETSSDNSVGSPWPVFSMGNNNASFQGYGGQGKTDNSFLGAVWEGDFFMGPLDRPKDSPVNYITYAEDQGFVGFHGHPLNGTKFFTWGQSGPGRFMQDFLGGISGPEPVAERSGDYAELQVGPAFTQFQTFDLGAGTTLEWSEFFAAFEGDPATLQGDYSAAIGAVEGWLVGPEGVNDTAFLEVDDWLASIADRPVTKVLSSGTPWGAVEEIRRASFARTQPKAHAQAHAHAHAHPSAASSAGRGRGPRAGAAAASASGGVELSPGLAFDHAAAWADPETKPWCELATYGEFTTTADLQPLSFQIGADWVNLLLAAEAKAGPTWLTDLHLGVALAERGLVDEPLRRFQRSAAAKSPNPIALRNALMLCPAGDLACAADGYPAAFAAALALASTPSTPTSSTSSSPASPPSASADAAAGRRLLVNLGSEYCVLLQTMGAWPQLAAFLASPDFASAVALSPALDTLDTVLVSRVYAALRGQSPADPTGALAVLTAQGAAGCFPTLGKARVTLMDLWFEAQADLLAAAKGRPLTPIEARDNRVDHPVPRNIGCPYASWSGTNKCVYW